LSPYSKGLQYFRRKKPLSSGQLYTNDFDREAFECGWLDAEAMNRPKTSVQLTNEQQQELNHAFESLRAFLCDGEQNTTEI
jgi:hypothetical protein